MNELHTLYPLTPSQLRQYQEQGYIKLKNVLSPAVLGHYGRAITAEVIARSREAKPLEERTTYGKAFLQIMNLWRVSDVVREFVFSQRLGRIAAELMGVAGVRMYHDQALYKEAGGGFTPWHADQQYWPLANDNTTTAWIPLQATPLDMGPLQFSIGSQKYNAGRDLEIGEESEKRISKTLLEKGLPLDETPYDLGEVSFHGGWTFHRAGPNTTGRPRAVMTIIYMEDGMRLAPPKNKNQESDWNSWLPGAVIGLPIDTPLNPVLYRP
jgi:ectoine hydroxylase-related dioxygenase (phytanoyl-CoA dioxygenase family)